MIIAITAFYFEVNEYGSGERLCAAFEVVIFGIEKRVIYPCGK